MQRMQAVQNASPNVIPLFNFFFTKSRQRIVDVKEEREGREAGKRGSKGKNRRNRTLISI